MNYIETDRLILRSWRQGDLPLFAKMNKDSRVMRCFPATLSDAETEAFYNRIQNEFDSKGWGLYAVEIKSTGESLSDMLDCMRLVSMQTSLPELK